ncbi:HWE histidine kinase domain-containing protein [Aestuariivita sp.]|jgi:light-regulated signal transduction histidine kinase (bacteriophytochrome)|uniref:HWE histidine kinase domain-containing protein n=1 Tax=Aestuariivita sp. TaxID=1872407 RepID=UPI00216F27DC|nr:HWE histidine kinase domain-containing protein [Aestuariivita sp.]MCE8008584.1 GAF domain-containing protein [Aestuariivita sp.]
MSETPDQNLRSENAHVDLTDCDREPIHILGRVQDYGCLIAMSLDWMVTHVSHNCSTVLGLNPDALIGTRIVDILPEETIHHLRSRMQVLSLQQGAARVFSYPVFGDDRHFDVFMHNGARNIVFEFEPRTVKSRHMDDADNVQALIARVQRHDTLDAMAKEAARGLKVLSGFDRVMVYRFAEDESGTVIAETLEPGMEPYLGLRYPASDIPKQARALYTRNVLRIIADVDGPTHAIHPEFDPHGDPLDLSMAVTRAVSPIHLDYLRNMGVAASMSVSILRNGKLWGLFSCHHRAPRHVDYERRSTIELFAQLFNYELAQLEMHKELADVDRARDLHDRLMAQLSDGQDLFKVFDAFTDEIAAVIPFDGAAILSNGRYKATGAAPTHDEFRELSRFLNTAPPAEIYATDHLVSRYPQAAGLSQPVAGLLALPVSRTPRDYLVLFRSELAQSVTWAGNPEKPAEKSVGNARLTPRKSFAAWQEIVRDHSAPWKDSERRAADALRVTLLEVVLKLADESNAARKRAQDHQEVLIAELNHRVRNILNLIRGLVSQGQDDATTIDAYRSVLDARIHALARAHDQLTDAEWDWTSLGSMIDVEVKAFLSAKADRVRVTGRSLDLTPNAFTTLALVIHELVTNSAKYGSLSGASGSVTIDIDQRDDGAAVLQWREQDGPPVKKPTRKGFGTTIIERSIPFELTGEADLRYPETGLEADFVLPAKHVRRAKPAGAPKAQILRQATGDARLSGNALILEDNMIIALDATDMLVSLGASHVHTASNVADAMAILERNEIGFALIDVNLGDEFSYPVVEKCLRDGLHVVLATGYGSGGDLVARFPRVAILKKPYTIQHLKSVL